MKIVAPEKIGESVLIAEDHTRTREALKVLFERKSYNVIEAKNYRNAVATLTAPDGPSLALLDWMLPDGSGLDICREVRKRVDDRYIYLIVITGRDGEEDVAQALSAGADDFIHKPCGPVELMARVRNGLRMVELERSLLKRITDLEHALKNVEHLEGLLKQK